MRRFVVAVPVVRLCTSVAGGESVPTAPGNDVWIGKMRLELEEYAFELLHGHCRHHDVPIPPAFPHVSIEEIPFLRLDEATPTWNSQSATEGKLEKPK